MENHFPDEIKRAIDGIKSESRQKIISELMTKGQASYSELKNELNPKSKGSFNYHLGSLLESGLVTNYIQGHEDSDYLSYYEISNFGKSFINSLFASLTYMVPKKEVMPMLDIRPVQRELSELTTLTDTLRQIRNVVDVGSLIHHALSSQPTTEFPSIEISSRKHFDLKKKHDVTTLGSQQ